MNSKIFIMLIFLAACGVDKPPKVPADSMIPSLPSKYTKDPYIVEGEEDKKNKKSNE